VNAPALRINVVSMIAFKTGVTQIYSASETASSSIVWFWCFCRKCDLLLSLQFLAQSLK